MNYIVYFTFPAQRFCASDLPQLASDLHQRASKVLCTFAFRTHRWLRVALALKLAPSLSEADDSLCSLQFEAFGRRPETRPACIL